MSKRIPVSVEAGDPVTRDGIASQLRRCRDVRVVENGEREDAPVTIVASEEVDDGVVRTVRKLTRNESARVVVVVSHPDDGGLVAAVEAGARGLLRRSEASPERLGSAVRRALDGDGMVPPDLLGRLLEQVGRLQRNVLEPQGMRFNGLSEREVDVLRLVAQGRSTVEIADELAYSERTIKNVIHNVTVRLGLRNRAHAVAYAVREGLI